MKRFDEVFDNETNILKWVSFYSLIKYLAWFGNSVFIIIGWTNYNTSLFVQRKTCEKTETGEKGTKVRKTAQKYVKQHKSTKVQKNGRNLIVKSLTRLSKWRYNSKSKSIFYSCVQIVIFIWFFFYHKTQIKARYAIKDVWS